MSKYIYMVVFILFFSSLIGNKVLYDARARAQAEIKMLTAEIALREKEAKVNAEIGVKHAKELATAHRLYADTKRKLERVLAEVAEWSNTRVPNTIVNSLRDAICKTDSSNAACKPATRTNITSITGTGDERRLDTVHCRPVGSYLNGESGQAILARIF